MIPDQCCYATNVSKIKIEERGIKVVFLNSDRKDFVKIKVDGCVVSGTAAADWVVGKHEVGDVVVELKGRNIEHAVDQVSATLSHWTKHNWCRGKIAVLIVSNQVPKATISQKAKQKFKRDFGCPLHIVSHNQEYTFENILSSKGPYKS